MIAKPTALAALATVLSRVQRLNVAQDPVDAAETTLKEFIEQHTPDTPPEVTESTGAEAEFEAGRQDAHLTPAPSGTETPIRLAGRLYQDLLDGKLRPTAPAAPAPNSPAEPVQPPTTPPPTAPAEPVQPPTTPPPTASTGGQATP